MAEITLKFDDAKFGDVVASVCAQSGASIGIVGVELADMKISINGAKLVLDDVIVGLCKNYGLHYTRTAELTGTLRQLTKEEIAERARRDAEIFEDDEFEEADPTHVADLGATAPGVGVDPDEVGVKRAQSQAKPQAKPPGFNVRGGQARPPQRPQPRKRP